MEHPESGRESPGGSETFAWNLLDPVDVVDPGGYRQRFCAGWIRSAGLQLFYDAEFLYRRTDRVNRLAADNFCQAELGRPSQTVSDSIRSTGRRD